MAQRIPGPFKVVAGLNEYEVMFAESPLDSVLNYIPLLPRRVYTYRKGADRCAVRENRKWRRNNLFDVCLLASYGDESRPIAFYVGFLQDAGQRRALAILEQDYQPGMVPECDFERVRVRDIAALRAFLVALDRYFVAAWSEGPGATEELIVAQAEMMRLRF